jgi:hypothetical protein
LGFGGTLGADGAGWAADLGTSGVAVAGIVAFVVLPLLPPDAAPMTKSIPRPPKIPVAISLTTVDVVLLVQSKSKPIGQQKKSDTPSTIDEWYQGVFGGAGAGCAGYP